jgi:hypothetical protein
MAKAALLRVKPVTRPEQSKRNIFVREVAEHLRSTTKAKTWSEWELDKNFETFCNQVHEYETEQSSARWLECENRALDIAKTLMNEESSSSGALSFSQARDILVEKFSIRLENDVFMKLLTSSRDGSISRAQKLHETYKRLVGSAGYKQPYRINEAKWHNREEQQIKCAELDTLDSTYLMIHENMTNILASTPIDCLQISHPMKRCGKMMKILQSFYCSAQ